MVDIIGTDVEGIQWVNMRRVDKEKCKPLSLAVCYIAPESSSRGVSADELLQLLVEQVDKFSLA